MAVQAMGQLHSERSEQLVEQTAHRLNGWRLALPSLLFLEITKPFSFVASQGLLLCQPFLGFLGIERQVADYAELLADRSNIDQLIALLEQEMDGCRLNGMEED